MNDGLVQTMLANISNMLDDEHKNDILNQLEEYIEWCNYSNIRFNKDYNTYLKLFQDIQADILLNEYLSAGNKITEYILKIK